MGDSFRFEFPKNPCGFGGCCLRGAAAEVVGAWAGAMPEVPMLEGLNELGGGVDGLATAPGVGVIEGGQLLLTVVWAAAKLGKASPAKKHATMTTTFNQWQRSCRVLQLPIVESNQESILISISKTDGVRRGIAWPSLNR